MLGEKDVEEFFESESDRLESEHQKHMKEKGYATFFNAPVGETLMTVKYQVPRLINGKYGSRKAFRIIVDGKKYDFTVNDRSPLYRYLIRKFADAKKDIQVVLVRTGTGKTTKYDVKEA